MILKHYVQLLYIDRVVNYRHRVVIPRLLPIFIGWTNEIVMKREAIEIERGGFGKGMVDLPATKTNEVVNEDDINDINLTKEKVPEIITIQVIFILIHIDFINMHNYQYMNS